MISKRVKVSHPQGESIISNLGGIPWILINAIVQKLTYQLLFLLGREEQK